MKYTTCFRPAIAALIFAGLSGNAISAQGERGQPKQLIVDKSLPQVQLKTNEAVAREYATFWNTGNETLARDALAANFVDKTPPEGRKQGPEGAILASRSFRTAVPDLRCAVEQTIISGGRGLTFTFLRHIHRDIWQAERKGAENRFYRHGYL